MAILLAIRLPLERGLGSTPSLRHEAIGLSRRSCPQNGGSHGQVRARFHTRAGAILRHFRTDVSAVAGIEEYVLVANVAAQ
jgi:hypothetical protein